MQKTTIELCKFSGPTEYALQNLESRTIFCQHYSAFNDPFEFWTRIHKGVPDPSKEPERFLAAVRAWGFDFESVEEAQGEPHVWDNFKGYFDECQLYAPKFKEMQQKVRIACFGSEKDNLLMWSHYGDGLRGFCVIFDEALIENAEPAGHLLDVTYLKEPPKVDSFVYGVAWDQDWYSQTIIDETINALNYQKETNLQKYIPLYDEAGEDAVRMMLDIWQKVFAAKPAEWSYERERRLLVQTNKKDSTAIFRNYPEEAVKEVIFGERMSKEYKDRILTLLNQSHSRVDVKTARRAKDQYKVVFD